MKLPLQFFIAAVLLLTFSTVSLETTKPNTVAGNAYSDSNMSYSGSDRNTTNSARITTEMIQPKCAGLDDRSALAAAIGEAKGGSITIGPGQTCAASEITIPNLRIEQGGLLKPLTGKSVILSGNFEAGLYQVFVNALPGQGRVVFSNDASIKQIVPQWWGAKGDKIANDTLPIRSAVESVPAGGGEIFFPAGTYLITDTIVIRNDSVNLRGVGFTDQLFSAAQRPRNPALILRRVAPE